MHNKSYCTCSLSLNGFVSVCVCVCICVCTRACVYVYVYMWVCLCSEQQAWCAFASILAHRAPLMSALHRVTKWWNCDVTTQNLYWSSAGKGKWLTKDEIKLPLRWIKASVAIRNNIQKQTFEVGTNAHLGFSLLLFLVLSEGLLSFH